MTKINAWMHSLCEIPIPSIIPCCARGSFMTGESRTVGRRVTAIRVTDRCWGGEGGAAAGSPLSLTDSPLSAWRVCELTHGTGVVYGWSVCQWNFVSPHPYLSPSQYWQQNNSNKQIYKQKDNRWQYAAGFAWLTIPLSFPSFSSSSHFFSPII